ncbi:CBS domain-containing protein [Paenibacillus helianthi]|uniref:CBS domain-containing protein n=1 Tax=Paenibacillus helianthi TaxID=1349432 RepID=A0ABX3EPC7_9BACL|nr:MULTISPECIES: CBS domain-containing protein [Paenibacillus]OKP87513.1 CBS domain-containing protein [Paenibacillus helianthi]OKP89184.1 CBS domain-containing protein [Paenibacillus sp. P32E]OKP92565.1 CBS domain-containing protein [Paenibacillus sp. P3E]
MKAQEFMVRQVYKVKETDTVRTFIERCIQFRISGMPVVNERNEIVAYLSDGDIMRYIGKHEDLIVDSFFQINVFVGDNEEFEERTRRLLNLNVMDIAKKKVITVPWDEDIERIATILGKKQIKKVPVERNRVLVGIISRGDVIRHTFKTLL